MMDDVTRRQAMKLAAQNRNVVLVFHEHEGVTAADREGR